MTELLDSVASGGRAFAEPRGQLEGLAEGIVRAVAHDPDRCSRLALADAEGLDDAAIALVRVLSRLARGESERERRRNRVDPDGRRRAA